MSQVPQTHSASRDRERNILWITYILYAVSIPSAGLLAVVAVIINHIKYGDAPDTVIASHHRWLLRTFWFAVLWIVICFPLTFVIVGFVGYAIITIWFVYRLVRGILALLDNKALPMPGALQVHG